MPIKSVYGRGRSNGTVAPVQAIDGRIIPHCLLWGLYEN